MCCTNFAQALLSDDGYLLIQAFFQALQSYSWGFALIQSLSKLPTWWGGGREGGGGWASGPLGSSCALLPRRQHPTYIMPHPRVASLHVYPVKGCKGIDVEAAYFENTGKPTKRYLT